MLKKITKTYVVCPHCEETTDSAVDHLKAGQVWGSWHCNRCGRAYRGVSRGDGDTTVEKCPRGERSIETLVLLEYPPSDKPLRFLMGGRRYTKTGDQERGDSSFYYESHSCPTNWIGDAVMISLNGDTDPHGFLRYVREVDRPDIPDASMEEDEALVALFPEMLDQKPIKPRAH